MKLRVLLISYYWPPAGGPGVQRWLKLSKYLNQANVKVTVYTAENPSYPIIDNSLESEVHPNIQVIKKRIIEPYSFGKVFSKKTKDHQAGMFEENKNQSWASKLAIFIRGNFFIPDARFLWVKPSVRFLKKYTQQNSFDAIITTGPPHSLHLIGLGLKKVNPNILWLADFRDPWTEISYHKKLKLLPWASKKHKNLEQKVLQSADLVLAASYSNTENYTKKGAKKAETLLNGFDSDDFNSLSKSRSENFTITYVGGLESARNPVGLWEALESLFKENKDLLSQFTIKFVGNISSEIKAKLLKTNFASCLEFISYVPHNQSLKCMFDADLLWLTNFPKAESAGIIPGKIFEYLATGNPILGIGPDHADVQKILLESKSGKYFLHNDSTRIKDYILSIFNQVERKNPSNNFENYSRKNQAKQLIELIVSQLKNKSTL